MGIDTSMGFVAFPRGLTAWEWYDDPNTCRLFFHLLLTANWEPKNWHGIVVSPGSRVASVKKLAEETGLTIKNVRTSLEKLKTTNYLAIKATNKYSVISIENWGAITGSGKLTGNQPANNRQTNGNQLATTKPLKQINNITSSFPLPPSQQGEAPQAPASPPLQQPPSLDGLETSWRELGLGRRMGPVVQQALRAYLAAGLEDALIVQAMREAAEHDARPPCPISAASWTAARPRASTPWTPGRRPTAAAVASGWTGRSPAVTIFWPTRRRGPAGTNGRSKT